MNVEEKIKDRSGMSLKALSFTTRKVPSKVTDTQKRERELYSVNGAKSKPLYLRKKPKSRSSWTRGSGGMRTCRRQSSKRLPERVIGLGIWG